MNTLPQYWSDAHKSKSIDKLSGFTLAQHLAYLQVELPKGNVLCIGAGTGDWIREIKNPVTVLDICPEAFDDCITDPATLPTDYFDLAISHWVAPHMDRFSLDNQIHHVLRSLKKGGLFALHYAEPQGGTRLEFSEWVMKAGRCCYFRSEIAGMVIANGGQYEVVSTEPVSYERIMVVIHIRKL